MKNERLIFWLQGPFGRLEIIFGRVKKSFQDRSLSQVTSSFGKFSCAVPSLRRRHLKTHLVRNRAPSQGWKEVTQPPTSTYSPHIKALSESFSKLPPFLPSKTCLQDDSHFNMNVWTTLAFETFLHFYRWGLIAFNKITPGGKSIEVLSLISVSLRFLTSKNLDVSLLLQKGLVNHRHEEDTVSLNSRSLLRPQSWLRAEKTILPSPRQMRSSLLKSVG